MPWIWLRSTWARTRCDGLQSPSRSPCKPAIHTLSDSRSVVICMHYSSSLPPVPPKSWVTWWTGDPKLWWTTEPHMLWLYHRTTGQASASAAASIIRKLHFRLQHPSQPCSKPPCQPVLPPCQEASWTISSLAESHSLYPWERPAPAP